MQFTQKEESLLKELKGQEDLCVQKYQTHASDARDPQLKDLFQQLAQAEQQHLNTISDLQSGTVPQGGQSGPGSSLP